MKAAGRSLPQIGSYRITSVLGRGGMGVVYRAKHPTTGAPVALKTVALPSASAIAAIRREIHALGRLQHPGIVRFLDQGVSDGLPWVAMELVSGQTLRGHLDRVHAPRVSPRLAARTTSPSGATTRPDAPRLRAPPAAGGRASIRTALPLLALLRRLTAPLAHLHAAGLVHRDLKPDNVIVRRDGTPVLVDLGIAAQFGGVEGREAIEIDGMMGSLPYMAPEQIRGALVDARADLYALGCILFECITGAPPFAGRDAAAMRHGHLNLRPPPPSSKASGVPDALDRLVARLLAKRPEDRIGYAEDVADALAALDGPGSDAPAASRSRAYLYRPALEGRAAILAESTAAIEALAAERRGGLWFFGGESGVGKTRLALEIAQRAVQKGVTVWTGSAVLRGDPLHLVRPALTAIADRCRAAGADMTARQLGPRGKLLAPYAPAIADLPGVRELPEPPPLPPEAARARVLDALEETLLAFATPAPILLVLDDLQWADDLSLGFLTSLAAKERGHDGLFVLGTYRLEERTEELSAIVRRESARDVQIGRLDREGVAAMITSMVALVEPPRDLVDGLHLHTGGNPFFVAEYLRAALGEGLLARDAAGRFQLGEKALSITLPHTLGELVERRLSALGELAARVVAWAAVLGRDVDTAMLDKLGKFEDVAMLDAIEELRVRQILEEKGDGRLAFVHDTIREVAQARIAPALRRAMHHRVALALTADGEERLAEIGHHHAEAGDHPQASVFFARAADRARASYANGEAIRLYRAAVEEAQGAAPAGVLESLGDVLGLVGRQQEARQAYADTLAVLPAEGAITRARVHRKIGKAWEVHHDHGEALAAYAEAEAALGASAPRASAAWWDAWVEVQIDRIAVFYWAARVDEMAAIVERVRPVVQAGGTAAQRARFFRALTQIGLRSERYLLSAETVRNARACLLACEQEEGSPDLAATRFAFATVLLWHGALDEAEARLLDALAEAERTGDVTLEARSLTYLTQVWRRRRRVAETRAWAKRSLGTAEAAAMDDYVGAALANLSWVALAEGDFGEVMRLGEAALARFRSSALVYPFQWMALLPLAAAALARGDHEGAACYAAALIEPGQQRLPEALTAALEAARDEVGTEDALRRALVRAGETEYL
ncbi:serine/threonine-protein kinase PknK [Polyangium fumosum]|uniref:Serine/threonine-protein kinase PknK n=1 Tax=Polyangium fumosum TaxID=889272 RepID=A0A4U1J3G7_9BACT|nr:serine/threonine-protein kinase [Polyangium fumosum]TKD01214.1 serine/threonine-protein kinase PknK [Polyangium fumosum]